MKDFITVPLFPKTIGINKIDFDTDKFVSNFEKIKFTRTEQQDSYNAWVYPDMYFLNSYPDLKENITNYFNKFKNEILKLETTDFSITTSWITKTTQGGSCQYHNHRNCVYSGVLYFDNYEGGDLVFNDSGINNSSFLLNDPVEYNIHNFKTFTVRPDKGIVVFFPSELMHKIQPYTGKKNRYSVAFNFLPSGTIGLGDSQVNLQLF